MKVEIKQEVVKFNPKIVTITLESSAEFEMFKDLMGSDETVSSAIKNKYCRNEEYKSSMKVMMSKIYHVVRVV